MGKVALVYETTDTGQVIAGRIRVVGGRLVGEPPDAPAVVMILHRPARMANGHIVSPEHPEAFLEALPSAYSGSMLRVGLETE